jgi:O-antigen ligase
VKPPQGKGHIRDRRSTLGANEEFSRTELWRAGFLAFREHPLFGLGPDNFRHAYGSYLGRAATDDRLHANNFYVEILSTMGIVGLAALVLLIMALARTARRAARAPALRVLVFGVAGALAAYLVHGTLDYFLEFTPTYALLWILAGTLAALERVAKREVVGTFDGPGGADR